MTEKEKDSLLQEAMTVLRGNWVDLKASTGFSKPAAHVYPYQWNWDAGFAAIGYSYFDIDRAIAELDALFSGQWENGMLPHIVFHTESHDYFPNQSFWQTKERNENAPRDVDTSGMTQPPIHAIAAWYIYQRLSQTDPARAQDWLDRMYPKLHNLHDYFYRERDQRNTGLMTIYHPWESGLDNSPRWDKSLAHLSPKERPEYTRLDTDFVDARFRPTDASYNIYVHLAELMRKVNYNDQKLQNNHPFQVEDIMLSSILHLATTHLIKIAEVLNKDTAEIKGWQSRFSTSVMKEAFSQEDQLFYDHDVLTEELIRIDTIATIAPIISGSIDKKLVRDLFSTLDTAGFCGSGTCQTSLLPSTSLSEESFNPQLYWRGPVWININWLIWIGLKNANHTERAKAMKQSLLSCLKEHGIWEYYSPEDLDGIGAQEFTWSAALAIDVLES